MRLAYDVSRAALIEASRQLRGLRPAAAAGAAMFIVAAVTTFWDAPAPNTISQHAYLVLFPVFVGLIFFVGFALLNWFVVIPMHIAAVHRQNPLLFGAMELALDQDGVELKNSHSITRYRWSDF